MLTGFNGTAISYDGAGDPTSYTNGKTDYRFEWVKGRSLQYAAIMGDEQLQAFYKYDADGIRNFKDVDGMTHNYITQNGKVVRETIGSGSTAKILDFIYDESGKPFALKYSTNGGSSFGKYYYVLNLQGDVVKLINTSGTVVANYTYNAWGEVLTSTGNMASVNPLRYRGYYYDTETGFYYLQSRYYDPVTHRFINADTYTSTGQGMLGHNMFAYCRNNPVLRRDASGFSDKTDMDGDGDIFEIEEYGGGGYYQGPTSPSYTTSSYTTSTSYYTTSSSSTSTTTSSNMGSGGVGNNGGGGNSHNILKTTWRGIQHWFGHSSPKKIKMSGGCYTQLTPSGSIHSYTVYNQDSKQVLRVDFQGKAHAGVLPHIHVYGYNSLGQLNSHRIYDVNFNTIG